MPEAPPASLGGPRLFRVLAPRLMEAVLEAIKKDRLPGTPR
jgi:hypothetical protein